MIEITDNMRIPISLNGVTDKFCVQLNNRLYILKQPQQHVSKGVLTYNLSCYTEHLASTFIRRLGYDCQRAQLCYYGNQVCCLLEMFTQDGKGSLRSFQDTRQSSVDDKNIRVSKNVDEYTYDAVLTLLQHHSKIPDSIKEDVIQGFWIMYFCDAILGNRDRHEGNWGYLTSPAGYKLAPIYDNGASLFPDVYRNWDALLNNPYEFYRYRTIRLPGAVFRKVAPDGHFGHSSYKDTISQAAELYGMAPAYKKFVEGKSSQMMYDIMHKLVSDIPLVWPLKQFFCNIVYLRYSYLFDNTEFDVAYETLKRSGLV